ncbi:response regulator transcription factor [Neorhizobium lilium]|uniref:Response regulator transcription factor n=1 Tax=Neorhizobium lilium TaxID=2503024 RepID=A0A444LKQ4_9HYPH|nr:response regulator transcription factor [Neorhizobium lilium]RWX80909.1 response regulator transcription factor [Neorhizobium lilium]
MVDGNSAYNLHEIGPSLHADGGYVALIDRRMLERECLAHSLNYHKINRRVLTFSDLRDWQDARDVIGIPSAVLFNTGSYAPGEINGEIERLITAVAPAAVVVLSDNQDLNSILDTIALGVRGYIPSSVNIDICIQAISLAIAGGRFIPASSVLGISELLGLSSHRSAPAAKLTNRQSAIAEALRRGKANKDIASELNLCESTIKVHIRNIMRKLGATNRTEVACRMGGGMFEH